MKKKVWDHRVAGRDETHLGGEGEEDGLDNEEGGRGGGCRGVKRLKGSSCCRDCKGSQEAAAPGEVFRHRKEKRFLRVKRVKQ